jgi:hypothetical protein
MTELLMAAKTDNRKRKGANAYLSVETKAEACDVGAPAAWLALLASTVATVAFAAGAGPSPWLLVSDPRVQKDILDHDCMYPWKKKHGTLGFPLGSADAFAFATFG